MVKNGELLERFEQELIAKRKPDYQENRRIADALNQEVVLLYAEPRTSRASDITLRWGLEGLTTILSKS